MNGVREVYDDYDERDNPCAETVALHVINTILDGNIFGPLFEHIKKVHEMFWHLRGDHWCNDTTWVFCDNFLLF